MEQIKNLNSNEHELVVKIISERKKFGGFSITEHMLKHGTHYVEEPVDILTFMDDPKYLGGSWIDTDLGKTTMYDGWRTELQECFPDQIHTNYKVLAATGAIGLGKSKIACAIMAYILYRDLCLKNPLQFYGLAETDTIAYGFANISLDLVEKVANDYFQVMLQTSPWFKDKGTVSGIKDLKWEPNNNRLKIILGSLPRHFLGQNVRTCFVDEISFAPTQSVEMQVAKAKDLLGTIERRQESRFIKAGSIASRIVGGTNTFLTIASSKRSELSFMERYIEDKQKQGLGTVRIVDKPQWEMKPASDYCGKKFVVAMGNKFLPSIVLPLEVTEETIDEYRKRGHKIIQVPIEYHEGFLDNVDKSLMDIAGVSSLSSMKYLSGAKYHSAINEELVNPFVYEVIECGTNDKVPYSDYFDETVVDPKMRSKPLFIHWDRSTSGDITGIGGVWILGVKTLSSGEREIHYRQAFNVGIKAPKGHEISYQKNRQFIYWLKAKGFNIKGISGDQFGGPESGQILKDKGFEYSYISVDRLSSEKINEPYLLFKQVMYDLRIELLPNQRRLENEIVDIELQASGKCDHPLGSSKDLLDGLVGAVWNASKHGEEFAYDYGEILTKAVAVNSSIDGSHASVMKEHTKTFEQSLIASLPSIQSIMAEVQKEVAPKIETYDNEKEIARRKAEFAEQQKEMRIAAWHRGVIDGIIPKIPR